MTSNYVSCFVCALSVDDVKATKINENLDVALQDLWPVIVYNGMDHTTLPDIEEGVSYIFSRESTCYEHNPRNVKSKKMRRGYAEKRIVMEHK